MATLYVGDSYTIRSTITDVDAVKIEISYNNGGNYSTIAERVEIEHSKVDDQEVYQPLAYVWTVEGTGELCIIRVSGLEGDEDISDQSEPFSIEERVATTIVITPRAARVAPGKTRQFSAVVYDQTETALDVQPAITWSTDAVHGTISATGLFTAGEVEEECTVTATLGDGQSDTVALSVVALTTIIAKSSMDSRRRGVGSFRNRRGL